MEVVVFLIKEGFPLPIFITENQHLNLNHSIYPRTTRFNISQHKPIQPPSQKTYNHMPRRYVVLWIPFSLHTNHSKNYLLLITHHSKSELLTPLKNDILNVATRSVATGEPSRSKSFTCGPDHQLLWIKLSRELTILTKVLHHVPGTRECSNRAPRVLGFIFLTSPLRNTHVCETTRGWLRVCASSLHICTPPFIWCPKNYNNY